MERAAGDSQREMQIVADLLADLDIDPAQYATAMIVDMRRISADEPQLAAAIRIQATFRIFHYNEIKSADIRVAALQVRLRDYLGTMD